MCSERNLTHEEQVEITKQVCACGDYKLFGASIFTSDEGYDALDAGQAKVRELVKEAHELLQVLLRLEQALPYWDEDNEREEYDALDAEQDKAREFVSEKV